MFRMLQKLSVPLGMAVLAVATPSSADVKQYSGVGCSAAFTSNTWSLNSNVFESTTAGGSIAVYCPVVRDRVGATNGPTGSMVVFDPSSTATISCTFRNQDSTGTAVSFTSASTTAAQTGNISLSFGAFTSGTGNADTYAFRCLLPTNGQIIAYRVNENAQTD